MEDKHFGWIIKFACIIAVGIYVLLGIILIVKPDPSYHDVILIVASSLVAALSGLIGSITGTNMQKKQDPATIQQTGDNPVATTTDDTAKQ